MIKVYRQSVRHSAPDASGARLTVIGKLGDHTRAGNAHCRSFPSWPDGVTENDKARGFGTVADIVPAVELAQ